jgi:hypothetical protein
MIKKIVMGVENARGYVGPVVADYGVATIGRKMAAHIRQLAEISVLCTEIIEPFNTLALKKGHWYYDSPDVPDVAPLVVEASITTTIHIRPDRFFFVGRHTTGGNRVWNSQAIPLERLDDLTINYTPARSSKCAAITSQRG